MPSDPQAVLARLYDRVVETIRGCWEWTGSKGKNGYGRVWDGKQTRFAHRVVYELELGPIPSGMDVLHRCDNPPCVRLSHLFLGNDRDNMLDASDKGRISRGTRHNSHLTEDDVRALRATVKNCEASISGAARAYGISQSTASLIVNRKTWRWVE